MHAYYILYILSWWGYITIHTFGRSHFYKHWLICYTSYCWRDKRSKAAYIVELCL